MHDTRIKRSGGVEARNKRKDGRGQTRGMSERREILGREGRKLRREREWMKLTGSSFLTHPKCGCSTVSNETVCAFKEQWSIANAYYPIGTRVALKCTVWMGDRRRMSLSSMFAYTNSGEQVWHVKIRVPAQYSLSLPSLEWFPVTSPYKIFIIHRTPY